MFDRDHPIRSTGDMRTWYTGKPCERTKKSHINVCVYDSTWEASDAFVLDDSEHVAAWVKNDHLGFEVLYVYRGVVRKYRPDFLVRLANGEMLVLETKGAGHRTGQGQAALSGGMGPGGKRPRRLWALALCGGESAGRDSRYSDQARHDWEGGLVWRIAADVVLHRLRCKCLTYML